MCSLFSCVGATSLSGKWVVGGKEGEGGAGGRAYVVWWDFLTLIIFFGDLIGSKAIKSFTARSFYQRAKLPYFTCHFPTFSYGAYNESSATQVLLTIPYNAGMRRKEYSLRLASRQSRLRGQANMTMAMAKFFLS